VSETIRPLMQERYADDPWKLLVGCILLNRAHGRTALPAAQVLFKRWPTAEAMAQAELTQVEAVVRDCGFQRRRAHAIVEMSRAWSTPSVQAWVAKTGNVTCLYGLGQYAQDSYDIFVRGRLDVEPDDRVLREYLAEQRAAA